MTSNPVTVPPDLPLDRLVEEYFLHGRHRVYPVVEGERPLGTVSLERVRKIPREDWPARTVTDTMTPLEETVTAEPQESVPTQDLADGRRDERQPERERSRRDSASA